MRPRVVILVLALLAPTGALRAQEVQPITLDDAVAAALSDHPDIAAAAARVRAARAAAAATGAERLPAVHSAAHVTRFEEPMVVAPLHGFDPSQPPQFDRTLVQGNVGLSYTIYDGGARGARMTRAEAQVTAADAAAARAADELIRAVVHAYLRVGTATEQAAARADLVTALQAEQGRATQLFAQGKVPRLAVLRADAALARAEADATLGTLEVASARADLERLTGMVGVTGLPMRAADAHMDSAYMRAVALERNHGIAIARARVAGARATANERAASRRPQLEATARYNEYGSAAGEFQGEWQGGVAVSYALFTGGARGHRIAQAEADVDAALADVRQAELGVARALDAAFTAHGAAVARAAALTTLVAQQHEVVRVELLSLNNGIGLQTDYIGAQAELARARAELMTARHAALHAAVDIAAVTGELSPEWIARHLEPAP